MIHLKCILESKKGRPQKGRPLFVFPGGPVAAPLPRGSRRGRKKGPAEAEPFWELKYELEGSNDYFSATSTVLWNSS